MRLFLESPQGNDEREDRYQRMLKNDYQIPVFRDADFDGDPNEGRMVVMQLLLSAINSYLLTQFGDYGMIRDNQIEDHQLQGFMWNFSRHADMVRALQCRLTRGGSDALGRLVSRPLTDIGRPSTELDLAGGPTFFGKLPQREGGSREQIENPENTQIRASCRPEGFDLDEADVFQQLGEFSLRNKVQFGCDEVMHDNPYNPGKQKGHALTVAELAEKQQRYLGRFFHEIQRPTKSEEGLDHGIHAVHEFLMRHGDILTGRGRPATQ
ncbi:hypothetical protein PENNAL_c0009G01794 [Penicillium nalgiovense]|uniref:Uncharacterized protein n=1 Tax=Penicillium nalgiovense TaxID=60175 RepID=A0A1V6YVT3_PENNA|nr:hypothetical protein PENNAL_c0009G01794 [Penicillium nalgiovense]